MLTNAKHRLEAPVIIKYNAGNIGSVVNALTRIGVDGIVTDDHDLIRNAPRVIFPGVGEASSTINYLRDHGLDEVIRSLHQPVLGICLGMQLMCRCSEEGDASALGIYDHEVLQFRIPEKVPHMGWNSIEFDPVGLFKGLSPGCFVYFVHSYYVPLGSETIATCRYGLEFTAAMQRNNFYATQFHPEKSGTIGKQILRNFLNL